jgi:hypothetical protein
MPSRAQLAHILPFKVIALHVGIESDCDCVYASDRSICRGVLAHGNVSKVGLLPSERSTPSCRSQDIADEHCVSDLTQAAFVHVTACGCLVGGISAYDDKLLL